MRPDELRGLESIHPGHVDVKQNDGAIVLEQPAQRVLPRLQRNKILFQFLQNGPEHQQLVVPIVDDQYVRPGAVRAGGLPGSGFAQGICGYHESAEIGSWH